MKKLAVSCLLLLILSIMAACSNLILYEDSPEPVDPVEGTNISETPPAVTIMIGDETIDRSPVNFDWCYSERAGEEICTETESLPPNELADTESGDVETSSDTKIELSFEEEPDSYTVKLWDAQNEPIENFEDIRMPTNAGIHIYEIRASWDQGEASYIFSLNMLEQ